MKKLIKVAVIFFSLLLGITNQAFAADQGSCSDALFGGQSAVVVTGLPSTVATNFSGSHNLNISGLRPNTSYTLNCQTEYCNDLTGWFCNWGTQSFINSFTTNGEGRSNQRMDKTQCWSEPGRKHRLTLSYNSQLGSSDYCSLNEYSVSAVDESFSCDTDTFEAYTALINTGGMVQGCFEKNDVINFYVRMMGPNGPAAGRTFYYLPQHIRGSFVGSRIAITANQDGYIQGSIDTSNGNLEPGDNIRINVFAADAGNGNFSVLPGCDILFPLTLRAPDQCTDEDRGREQPDGGEYNVSAFSLCGQLEPGSTAFVACNQCLARTQNQGIWTAVGCMSTEPGAIVTGLVSLGIGIGGGVALIMILSAGFMFTTSQGDPKRTEEAKEVMQSAVIGLLFVIFSVTILQFIGVNILKIPGFGGN